MQTFVGGWLNEDVAREQLKLVINELTHADKVLPYIAFVRAMDIIVPPSATLLDVGCGVGHYGVLCEHNYPSLRYHGTDASFAMIAEAKRLAPLRGFRVCLFEDNDFDKSDIVLLSQVVEMTDDPPAMLRLALDNARRYVILNRIRLTPGPSHRIEETTYCGNIGRNWLWNLAEIESIISQYGNILDRSIWDNDNQATFVIRVKR